MDDATHPILELGAVGHVGELALGELVADLESGNVFGDIPLFVSLRAV